MLRIISGKWKGLALDEVDRLHTRPTTDKNKEMLFNILGQYFSAGKVLDLFAGSGSLGLEALSRGMDQAYFVDNLGKAMQTIRKNLDKLDLKERKSAFLFSQDAIHFLETNPPILFDLILIDPPYHFPLYASILELIAKHHWLHSEGTLVLESAKEDILPLQVMNLYLVREKISGITKFNFYQFQEEQL